nr:MAG TPA: hypothetical protein [Caudoviricetes sp.]
MIGELPDSIICDNRQYAIRTDYRIALRIMAAFQDPELNQSEKLIVMLQLLIIDFDKIIDTKKAVDECIKFLDAGNTDPSGSHTKLYDWEQDEQMIFSSINKNAGHDVRNDKEMHWWTFMGLFNEIGDGMFAQVIRIRRKRAKHQKLDKEEMEFYRENRNIIDIKRKMSDEEKEQMSRINEMYM